jgi:hypothetical protein
MSVLVPVTVRTGARCLVAPCAPQTPRLLALHCGYRAPTHSCPACTACLPSRPWRAQVYYRIAHKATDQGGVQSLVAAIFMGAAFAAMVSEVVTDPPVHLCACATPRMRPTHLTPPPPFMTVQINMNTAIPQNISARPVFVSEARVLGSGSRAARRPTQCMVANPLATPLMSSTHPQYRETSSFYYDSFAQSAAMALVELPWLAFVILATQPIVSARTAAPAARRWQTAAMRDCSAP